MTTAKRGRPPTVGPPTVATSIRLPEELAAWIDKTANEEIRSVNMQIVYLLHQAKVASERGPA